MTGDGSPVDSWGGAMSDRVGRIVGVVGGAAVTVAALLVLGTWFPVTPRVVVAWVVLLVTGAGMPSWARRSGPWLLPTGFTLAMTGLGLLVRAAEGAPPRDHVGTGVGVGVVLFVVGLVVAVVAQRRFSAQEVEAEVERHRSVEDGER